MNSAGVVLLRSHWSLPAVAAELRRLRSRGVSVVIDIPTPVRAGIREIRRSDRSLPSRATRAAFEALWTPLAWPLADLLVQYDADGAPWRCLAPSRRLNVTNGVDVAARPLAPGWVDRESVNLVAAGALGHWHGYDRLLRGLAETGPGEPEVTVTIVGDGPERNRLVSLANRLGVASRVVFTGPLTGAAFDAALAQADIGVGSLGEHRRGGPSLSTLKVRDYLARGLPIAMAGDDPDLRDNPLFVFRIPDGESVVDVAALAKWLGTIRRQVRSNPACATNPAGIRAFANDRLDSRTRAAAILAALR
jgi:glycosyltransferase involved in cell wall biosynthesis